MDADELLAHYGVKQDIKADQTLERLKINLERLMQRRNEEPRQRRITLNMVCYISAVQTSLLQVQ